MEKKLEIEIEEKLKAMDFRENTDKPGLYAKPVDGGFAHWDFRKAKNGRFFVSIDGQGFEDDKESKLRPEYLGLREMTGGAVATLEDTTQKPQWITPMSKGKDFAVRGNETEISQVVMARRLDMISKVSSDKLGEGVLYHDLGSKLGMEPSAELIDMISREMGGIETEIIETKMNQHFNEEDGATYRIYSAIVRAKDTFSGTTGLGSAEEVIDYDEMKKTKRSFALTKAVRKAERNAKERLIPVPRKALVELVKDLIMRSQKGQK